MSRALALCTTLVVLALGVVPAACGFGRVHPGATSALGGRTYGVAVVRRAFVKHGLDAKLDYAYRWRVGTRTIHYHTFNDFFKHIQVYVVTDRVDVTKIRLTPTFGPNVHRKHKGNVIVVYAASSVNAKIVSGALSELE